MAPGDCSVPTTASISKTCVSACWMYWGSCGRKGAHFNTVSKMPVRLCDITSNNTFKEACFFKATRMVDIWS